MGTISTQVSDPRHRNLPRLVYSRYEITIRRTTGACSDEMIDILQKKKFSIILRSTPASSTCLPPRRVQYQNSASTSQYPPFTNIRVNTETTNPPPWRNRGTFTLCTHPHPWQPLLFVHLNSISVTGGWV